MMNIFSTQQKVEKQIQILFTYEYTVTAYEAVQIILYFLKKLKKYYRKKHLYFCSITS